MRAIVVGAGIGGLSTAIALRRIGVEATVFERAGELKEIGAGVALAANAVRALRGLGLADAIKDIGVPLRDAEICSWQGEVLSRLPVLEIDRGWERKAWRCTERTCKRCCLRSLAKRRCASVQSA